MKTPWIPEQGARFGRLVVTGAEERRAGGYWFVECTCDCGTVKMVGCTLMRSGNTTSCGCAHREMVSNRARVHGGTGMRLYKVWLGMRQRCSNSAKSDYSYYGGRGISVCDEWSDFTVFQEWAQESGYDDALTIERVDNDGSYSPENCRWATRKEQARNRRSNHVLAALGEEKSLDDWVADSRCAVGRTTLSSRVNGLGWEHERAIMTPAGAR